jgi:ParB family chromosome partitioning protein
MVAKQTGLGKGFGSLIPQDLDQSLLRDNVERIQKLRIQDVFANPDQPRKQFDEAAHTEMVSSIKQHGILQPLIVVRAKEGYRIVAGERRWRAAKAADLSHVPAIVRSLKELEEVEMALIENIQRVDLSAWEQAVSVFKLQQWLDSPPS